ncbi:large repetitive protein [Amycolatopsis regifaucium]|uniref:large repetitive protein n=1 Tax=Amycolatopsis regifaucium TaxID=546365 RepID=UPI001FC95012|nr:large repetitive protein [Amycolatopsis regifaucium]
MASFEAAVSDLVNAPEGSISTAWYNLEKDMKMAELALAAVNEKFAKQIKAVRDALEGETGESFAKYATAVLNTSDEVYDTITGKQFSTNMGNIGRATQAFVTTYWQLQKIGKQVYDQRVAALQADAQRKIQAATTETAAAAIVAQLPGALLEIKTSSDGALLKDLQNALGTLGTAYNARGADLVPLYISDGDTTTAAPGNSYQAQTRNNQQKPDTPELLEPSYNEQRADYSVAEGEQQPGQDGQGGQQPGYAADSAGALKPTESAIPSSLDTGTAPGNEKNGGLDGTGGATTPPAGDGMTPEAKAALGDAKRAAGDAIDGLAAKTDDPARKEALQDAKEAAQGAIDGLTGGAPGESADGAPGESADGSAGEAAGSPGGAGGSLDPSAGTSPGTGMGGGLTPSMPGLADAKKAAGKAIDELGKKTDDPKRKQALDDAKKAAEDAIDGLTSPTAPGDLTGGPGGPAADDAKEAANGAIDGLAKPDDSATRQQALEDAKKAASDAVDGVLGGDGTAAGSGSEAQDAAGKAIDDLIGQTDDPERKAALEEAKDAASDAIDKLTPDLGDAMQAAGDAIGELAQPGDSEARQQALEDAKKAASDAVDGVLAQEGADPEAQAERAQLLDAKEAAGKAIDDLIGQTDDPERKEALEDAKGAMSSAIDKMAAPEHFQQVQDAKLAAEKAIDGLGTSSDDPQRREALEAAKSAANDAIDRINDSPDLTGPEHDQALAQAREDATKAIDALAQPDDTPAERQELADAKAAASKAIDAIGGSAGGSGGGSAMHDFLQPATSAGGDVGGGAGGSGGGTGPAPATAGGPSAGKFDTQPLTAGAPVTTQGGPAPAGAPGGAGAGQQGMPMTPMGPMGGGMGGGAGGQGEKEREPQVWVQADQGAWGENDDSQSHVLGKN